MWSTPGATFCTNSMRGYLYSVQAEHELSRASVLSSLHSFEDTSRSVDGRAATSHPRASYADKYFVFLHFYIVEFALESMNVKTKRHLPSIHSRTLQRDAIAVILGSPNFAFIFECEFTKRNLKSSDWRPDVR